MSILHSAGQNRLLALEQELLKHRSHRQANQQEWLAKRWLKDESLDEFELDDHAADDSIDLADLDELDELDDHLDEVEFSSEPNVHQAFLRLQQPDFELPDLETPDLEIPQPAVPASEQPDLPSYAGLANLLADLNRSGRQSAADVTHNQANWTDDELEFNPFASAPTSAVSAASHFRLFRPDSFASVQSPSSTTKLFTLHLPKIELPEPDDSDSPTDHATTFESTASATEPSYATLSWILRESRQCSAVDASDESDDLFLDIAQTIDIEAELMDRNETQEFD